MTTDQKFTFRKYQYDANGRQYRTTRTDDTDEAWAVFEGLGQRVVDVSRGVTTYLVYDAFGQLAAEYNPWPASNGTRYLMEDQVGSPRVVMSASGAVLSTHDYLPLGEFPGPVHPPATARRY